MGSEATRRRYENTYSGVFYKRYVLGQWVAADGVVYSMFSEAENVYRRDQRPSGMAWTSTRAIAVDYGTANPTRFLEVYDDEEIIRVDREYIHGTARRSTARRRTRNTLTTCCPSWESAGAA